MKNLVFKAITFCLLFLFLLFVLESCQSREKKEWQEASEINTIINYKEFLNKYPESKYVFQASERIEQFYWENAESRNTVEEYENFLKEFPNGKYSDKAIKKVEKFKWNTANKENTLIACINYLEEFPNCLNSQKAKSKIYEIKKDRLISLQNASWGEISITETYGLASNFSMYTELSNATWSLLKHANIKPYNENNKPDLIIKISVIGKPLSKVYDVGRLYTGSQVSISCFLETNNDYRDSEKDFNKVVPSDFEVVVGDDMPKSPNLAPFWDLVEESYSKTIGKLLYKSFGSTPLFLALNDENSLVRRTAIETLGWYKEKNAVEPLITILLSNIELTNNKISAIEALCRIRDQRAIEPLRNVITDVYTPLNKPARKAIKNISGNEY